MTYAIAFGLDTETLKQAYPGKSWNNARGDMRKTLEPMGFSWQQGSVYSGGDKTTTVTCGYLQEWNRRGTPWRAVAVIYPGGAARVPIWRRLWSRRTFSLSPLARYGQQKRLQPLSGRCATADHSQLQGIGIS